MTIPSEVDVVVTPDSAADDRSYVDWPAIIAGIVLATAISILLLTFGSAIGLGFADFDAADDVPVIWIAIAAATWLLWVEISSFMAGGYLTGRLRRRHGDANEEESDVRDGAHGLLVWGGALVVGALIAVSGVGAAATVVGNIAGAVTNAASNVAGEAAEDGGALDPNAYFVDMLFRPAPATATATTTETTTTETPTTETPAAETPAAAPATDAATTTAPAAETPAATTTTAPAAPAATTPAPAATAPAPTPAPATTRTSTDTTVVRAEAGRIFAQSAISGELAADDRTYLAQVVSTNTGLSEAEAQARVDQVVTAIDNAKAQAVEVAEEARKMTVLGAFLTAASLLVSAVGAYWAAQKGGNHRDKNMAFPGVFRRW